MEAKAKALKIFEEHYERWESDPARLENGYQFEATYAAMIEELGREVLQASLGEVPTDKNLKKNSRPDSGS